jgi:hypothetical protein
MDGKLTASCLRLELAFSTAMISSSSSHLARFCGAISRGLENGVHDEVEVDGSWTWTFEVDGSIGR